MNPQLSLFPEIPCDICGKMIGANPQNPLLWNGVLDQDNNTHVCWNNACRRHHYQTKQKDGKITLSETPVVLPVQRFG